MGFLVLIGFPIDLLTSLSLLLIDQTRAIKVLAGARHGAIVQRTYLASATAGEQYRYHISNGGYRP